MRDVVSEPHSCSTGPPGEPRGGVSDCGCAGADLENRLNIGKRRSSRFLFSVLVVVFVLSVGMIHTTRFGESYDDAIYVAAAKSLATGAGYHIISLPEPVAQTLIPPFYPLVLSLIWSCSPRFPANLIWMMLLSVLAMMGFLGLTSRYLVSQKYATRWQALAIVTLAGVNWRMMTLATSIISEVLFALLSVATLYIAEKYEREPRGWIGAVLGLVAGLAFLTRTSGLVLLIALAVYFALRRKWRRALLPIMVGSMFVIAWWSWCYFNRNSGGGEHAAYYAGYVRGIDSTLDKLQLLNHSSRLAAHLKIIETNALGLILVWLPFQSLGLRSAIPLSVLVPLLLFFLALFASGLVRELRMGVRLLHVFLGLYVALHLIVPSHSYERYLMPIVPFLLLFLVREFSTLFLTLKTALTSRVPYFKKGVPAFIAIVLAAMTSIAATSNSTGIYLSLASTKQALTSAEDAEVFDWIRANTAPSDVLVCFADQKYFLYTERKAVRSVSVNILDLVVYQDQGPESDEMVQVFLNIVDENRGSFLIFGARDFEYQAPAYGQCVQSYLEQHPEEFVPEFRSMSNNAVIYRIRRGRTALQ